jgi:hypothetical protein
MKLKYLLFAMFSVLTIAICGCGTNGGDGLNGGITVTATATGSVITATASYTNPTVTNLIGVPIEFSVQIGNQTFSLGTHNTNNSGTVSVVFTPPAFSGTQTVTVIAKTGNLTNFATLNVAGTTLTLTPPPTVALSTALPAGTAVAFNIPPNGAFATITDPFSNNLEGHLVTISTSVISTNQADTLVPPSATTTSSAGTAPFPGATGTLITPATVGGVETMTITWRVTDTFTGQTGTGITTVTLTKTL